MYKLIFEMPAFNHVSVYEYKKRADAVRHGRSWCEFEEVTRNA